MIDISGPKVSIPFSLFMLLSPWPTTSRESVLTRALIFMLAYRVMASKVFGLVLTTADIIVPTILFILLSPGMLLTIPQMSKGLFLSGQTNATAIVTHTLVFAIVFALARKTFPQYY